MTAPPNGDGPRRRRRRRRGAGRPSGPTGLDEAARRLGIQELYAEQRTVLEDVLAGRDVLMVLPTGFGKSACYQIPSMILAKPVLVISPLLALMRDQETKLVTRGIPCVRIDGTVRGRARREALARVSEGGPLLVMTTPETASADELGEVLARTGVGLAAVDEAHCISEWGHDFRPAYRRLGPVLRALGAPPVLALTATATPRVRESIVGALSMRDPAVVASSPHRSNLAFEVTACEGDQRLRALIRLVQRLRRPGIIYCATTREVDEVYTVLRRFAVPAMRYHGKMASAERNLEQKRFMRSGRRTVMVATNAFGLGIDKPDIRYILHLQSPASLEQYVQEAGRAGRDGRRSNCILLWDPTDRGIHEHLLSRSRVRPDQLYRLGAALAHWAREGRTPSNEALALSAELGPRIASALLGVLEEAGLAHEGDDGVVVDVPPDTLEEQARGLGAQFETLRTQDSRRLDSVAEYAFAAGCRAVFLRLYFGEEDGEPCGLCDICLGRGERPDAFFAPLASRRGPEQRARGERRGRRGGRKARHPRPLPQVVEGAKPESVSAFDLAAEPLADLRDGSPEGGERRGRRRRRRRGGRGRRGRGRGGPAPSEGSGGSEPDQSPGSRYPSDSS